MQPLNTPEAQDSLTHKPNTSTSSNQKAIKKSPDGRISRRLNTIAAVLVIVAITGTSLWLFRSHQPSTDGSPTSPVGTPVIAHVQAGGLEFFMRITPGPYFLSELFAADLSLTNHTRTTFMLFGPSEAGPCGAALFLDMIGGSAPNYTLPVSDVHSCPPMRTQLKPGETLIIHQFTPLSSSGEITLTPGANFFHTQVDPDGSQSTTPGKSPLDGHWPSIKIHVSSRVPIDRKISLQQEGTQVQISAPAAARIHLYYIYNVTCDAFQGGTVGTGNFAWEPISTTILHQPDCGDYGNQNIRWSYAVSAPGYAIVSGQHPAG